MGAVMKSLLHITFGASALAWAAIANAQLLRPVSEQLKNPEAADVTIISHVLEPEKLPIKKHLKHVRLPPGFSVNVFADNLVNPRMIAVANDGTVYVTRRDVGDVLMLKDINGDGVADEQRTVARRPGMHGITIDGSTMYLVTVKDVYRTSIQPDGSLSPLEHLVDDLPDGGQHPNRTIDMGPDGKLYISVGSSCNACSETNPEHATMLQMEPDGSSRKIFASGLRNTVGFGFEPNTRELFGMDHGIDWLGDNEQYEELNHLVDGNQYGWPYIYDDGKRNPQNEPPADVDMKEWAARSVDPIGFYTPHAAPMQMTFYTGEAFPAEYSGDAFVTMRGSWNRKPPSGYEIARIRFSGGRPESFEAFATGFLVDKGKSWQHKGIGWGHGWRRFTQWGHKGRLAGIAQTPDGALLVSDDTNGVMYRIAYTGNGGGWQHSGVPTNAHGAHVRVVDRAPPMHKGVNVMMLAISLVGPGNEEETLSLQSPAFPDGASIPETFAAEGENISPPLEWSKGPKGTKSYAVIMEDPDAPQNPPFVHWQIYNIPAEVTQLPKGIPQLVELLVPEGARQGLNDRGSVGYYGPRPPADDPAHSYHFQVFALDTHLDLPVVPSRSELLKAMEGHVLTSGEIVGMFER